MKIRPRTKLALRRETLRSLNGEALAAVQGGSGQWCEQLMVSKFYCPPPPPVTTVTGTVSKPGVGCTGDGITTLMGTSPVIIGTGG